MVWGLYARLRETLHAALCRYTRFAKRKNICKSHTYRTYTSPKNAYLPSRKAKATPRKSSVESQISHQCMVYILGPRVAWTPETLRASQSERDTSVPCCLYLCLDSTALEILDRCVAP